MKKKNDIMIPIIATFVVALLMTVMLIVYYGNKPLAQKGSKRIVIEVVIPDEKPHEYEMYTDAEYLGEALKETNFIKGNTTDLGFYVTEVKGRTADDSKNEWWCLTKGGEDVYTGVDLTPIYDGDHYEFSIKTY